MDLRPALGDEALTVRVLTQLHQQVLIARDPHQQASILAKYLALLAARASRSARPSQPASPAEQLSQMVAMITSIQKQAHDEAKALITNLRA